MSKKVLLVGESWMSSATHYKGFDQFGSVTFHLGAEPLVSALKDSPFDLTYMPAHEAVNGLPASLEGLSLMTPSFCPTSAPTRSCCTPTFGCTARPSPTT